MGLPGRISAFFGRSEEDALSVPPMDGIFKPNTRLETAERLLQLPAIDNLAMAAGMLYCSSNNRLCRVDPRRRSVTELGTFGFSITAIATSSTGQIAIAVEKSGVEIILPDGGGRRISLPDPYAACVTSALFQDEDTILLSVGSQHHALSDWKRDLMSRGASGLIARHTISTGQTQLVAENLAFPYGLAIGADGTIVATESWRHRIVSIRSTGNNAVASLVPDLPAYPARLALAFDGGYWLALFAPRRQLTEFVLREDDYRLEMMETIPPEAWIGPDFADSGDEDQPLQSGSVRQMGVMKPWAPSRSYGMVVRLDSNMKLTASYHSRADGKMHGIASVVELDGYLYAASRGSGTLLRLDPASEASS